jgi:hypothetical protein
MKEYALRTHGRKDICIQIIDLKPEGNRLLGRSRRRKEKKGKVFPVFN